MRKSWLILLCGVVLTAGALSGCAQNAGSKEGGPFTVTMSLAQVGEVPEKGNPVEKAIEAYTNTKLDIQWIPSSAFDEKVNVMIASSEMPKIMKVNYVPMVISSIQSGLFWEIGPYLDEYPNLSAQDGQHYKNISVDGKVYGIPLYRDIGRPTFNYRKDWLEKLGLSIPTNMEEWYEVQKAMVQNDPDGNGKNDTYGFVLDKGYNVGHSALTTRLAVSIGGVNKWGIVDGKMTPEFMTEEFMEVLKLFRRLFAEGLINQDFAVLDGSEAAKLFDSGRAGLGNSVAQSAKSQYDRLIKTEPDAVMDNSAFIGPGGIRLAGEPGHNGFLVIPKSAVPSEEELKKVLEFLNALMDEPATTLLMRGIKDVHYREVDGDKTEFIDFSLFQREVKPYRDNLPNVEGYNVKTLKDTPLGEKGTKMAKENAQYAIPNEALTLSSPLYRERGNELDQMISDAETRYIMGKIDDAGWEEEVRKWLNAGGEQVIKEFQESYEALNP